ncbi:MAG: T9SS type A sorting domain-containing protein [Flavobacteriales bacterium]|nr:T9SS type A sorting domain-containing protein [Flavobacteriales bacterium]
MLHQRIITALILLISSCLGAQNWTSLSEQIDLDTSGSKINCPYNDGDSILYVGGSFIQLEDGSTISKIAKWDGNEFTPIGCGFSWDCENPDDLNAYNGGVASIIRYHDVLYAAGYFQISGTDSMMNIASWNGENWVQVGDGFNSGVNRLRIINDTLYACGYFYHSGEVELNGLAKWSGEDWLPVNNLPLFDPLNPNLITDVALYQNTLYVAGNFSNTNVTIRDLIRFEENSWQTFGGGLFGSFSSVSEMANFNDELIISGTFTVAENPNNPGSGIVGWNGATWNTFIGGTNDPNTNDIGAVSDMVVDGNRLYACGNFTHVGGSPVNHLAFWEEDHWCSFVDSFMLNENQTSVSLMTFFQDQFIVAGSFEAVSENTTIHGIAQYIGGNECELTSTEVATDFQQIDLFPNPTNNSIRIKNLSPNSEVWVYDQFGRIVEFTHDNEINVSTWPNGMYSIVVKSRGGHWCKSFVKE